MRNGLIKLFSILAKHAFRVSTKKMLRGRSIILQANDQHDKKQWLNKFHSVISDELRSSSDKDDSPTTESSPWQSIKEIEYI